MNKEVTYIRWQNGRYASVRGVVGPNDLEIASMSRTTKRTESGYYLASQVMPVPRTLFADQDAAAAAAEEAFTRFVNELGAIRVGPAMWAQKKA